MTPPIKYFFIRRPVLAAVISIVIVLLGGFALLQLPISRYPQITPPAVQVSATYPGATAEDVALAVAAPIEQQLSGLDGLLYYKSSNSSDGVMNLQIYFDIGRDQDLAAVDVQNAITARRTAAAGRGAPAGASTIQKSQTDILLVASLTSEDPRYDATYLTNYAKLYVDGRAQAHPRRRRCQRVRRPRLLDAAPARSGPDGAARPHGGRRAGRGAGAERHQPGRAGSAASRRHRAPSSPFRSRPWDGSRPRTSSPTSSCAPGRTARCVRVRDIGTVELALAEPTTWSAGSTASRPPTSWSISGPAPTSSRSRRRSSPG